MPTWPPSISNSLASLAQDWLSSPACPRPDPQVLTAWDALAQEWSADDSLPLLIRRSGLRGTELAHRSGRPVVAVDNSPAHWAIAHALRGEVPSLQQVRQQLESGELPVVFIASKEELATARYRGVLSRTRVAKWPNQQGWKVCHIDPVGLKGRVKLPERGLDQLIEAARRLITPRNMFLVPNDRGGFGELPEVIEVARTLDQR